MIVLLYYNTCANIYLYDICNLILMQSCVRCRRLPKAMRNWPAYIDLKKKIDDFNETCPLLEMMANKAMQPRHWERMSKLCKYHFDVESETFTLACVMQAPLLKYKDEVEVLFKLKQIIYFNYKHL